MTDFERKIRKKYKDNPQEMEHILTEYYEYRKGLVQTEKDYHKYKNQMRFLPRKETDTTNCRLNEDYDDYIQDENYRKMQLKEIRLKYGK